MRLKSILAPLAISMFFVSCKPSYDLKFDPVPGTKYDVQMTTNSTTTQEAMGQKMEMNSITEMKMRYEILEGAGDTTGMKVTFQSMKTTQNANGQEMVMDTENPDSTKEGSAMLQAMMGAQFMITVNSRGEVSGVKGMDEMIYNVLAANKIQDSVQKAQVTEGMKNFMSDEILRNMLEQGFKIFPGKKVAEGDSWKKEMVISKPLPMNITTTYTLKDMVGKVAKLGLESAITPGKGGMQMMGMTIETELTGSQTGNMNLDAETGMTLDTDIKQDISGKMKVMGQEIPMTIHSVITMTAKKI